MLITTVTYITPQRYRVLTINNNQRLQRERYDGWLRARGTKVDGGVIKQSTRSGLFLFSICLSHFGHTYLIFK